MEALANYGSSSSSDEDEYNATLLNETNVKPRRERSGPFVVPISSQKINNVLLEQDPTCFHSTEITDDKLLEMNLVRIPRPLILSCGKGNNENERFGYNLSLFDKDYCTIRFGNHTCSNQEEEKPYSSDTLRGSDEIPPTNDTLEKKLDKLYQDLGDEDFSSHLTKQKDFTNPSIFPKVMDYFHIDGSGSNLPKDIWDPNGTFKPFEFIEKLTASEERAGRSRAATES